MIVIAGDIGGTNSRFRLCEVNGTNIKEIFSKTYKSSESSEFINIVLQFVKEANINLKDIYSSCLAVAGPVVNNSIEVTNLPWFIRESDLQAALENPKVKLLNDFSANAYGIETLKKEDIYTLQQGVPEPSALKAVVGAGTGLGVAYVHRHAEETLVFPTESGHVDYHPVGDEQAALLGYMRKKLHRVSVERILSGPGIYNIYKYVSENAIYNQKENHKLKAKLHQGDNNQAANIVEFALEHEDPMALRTLDIFIKTYGSVTGNVALSSIPQGGLYIVGGIAPRLLKQMTDGRFMESFLDKGRMSGLLKEIPVHIVMNTNIGLQGSALYASRL